MKVLINKMLAKLGYKIEKRRTKEDIIFATQKKLVNAEGPLTVFDVGAHIGDIALKYNQVFGQRCQIYSFEPFAQSFEALKKNTAGHTNIHVINKALGNTNGEALFNSNSFSATNSLLDTSELGIKNWGVGLLETKQKIKVPIQTIDNFLSTNSIPQIDILKLDTQGSEFLVWEGTRESIAAGKIKIIYTEMIVMPTYKGQKDLDEMLRLMKEYGFELYNLYNSYNPSGQLRFLDGIFVYKGGSNN